MKKFLYLITAGMISFTIYDYIVHFNGDIYFSKENQEIACFTKVEENKLLIDAGTGFEVFDMKGVNLGLGKPGKYATEFSITKDEYFRWFEQIQDLGANVI